MPKTISSCASSSEFKHEIACPFCDLRFHNRSKLNRHKREMHLGSFKQHGCHHCSKVFKRKEHLTRHIRGKHLSDKYKCPSCDVRFVELSRIRAHYAQFHLGELSSDRFSRSEEGWERFIPLHTCEACKYCFTQKEHLEAHTKRGCINTGDQLKIGSKSTWASEEHEYQWISNNYDRMVEESYMPLEDHFRQLESKSIGLSLFGRENKSSQLTHIEDLSLSDGLSDNLLVSKNSNDKVLSQFDNEDLCRDFFCEEDKNDKFQLCNEELRHIIFESYIGDSQEDDLVSYLSGLDNF